MKKLTALLLSVLLLFTLCAPVLAVETAAGGQFTDVPADAWYAPYVDLTCQSNLMKGNTDGTFNPGGSLTTAQAITIAARLHSRYSSSGDVIGSAEEGAPWYQPAVDYAQRNGILAPGEVYDYDSPIPIARACFVLLVSRALPDVVLPPINDILPGDIPDVTLGAPVEAAAAALTESGVLDSEDIAKAAADFCLLDGGAAKKEDPCAGAVYRLYRAGILSGNDQYGTFAPATGIRRSEVAAILSRVLDPSLRKHLELEEKPFSPVPMDRLTNLGSLRKGADDDELAQTYDIARELTEPLANLSREAQLYGVAMALRIMVEDQFSYSMTAPHYNDPYGFFVLHSASCAGCTQAVGLCLNMLGIPYEHVNEDAYTHQWARVEVNGVYWICDAYGLCCGPEPSPCGHPLLAG